MSREGRTTGWRRWRDLALATCTVWLVIQNVALLALVLTAGPARAVETGAAIAKTALAMWGQLAVLALAVVLALALAAWLVQAPAAREDAAQEVGDGR